MYVVVATGGKQCVFRPGQKYWIEKLDHDVGSEVELDQVLFLKDDKKTEIGRPFVAGAKVKVKVLAQGRDKKVKVLKFKRRKNYMKCAGHRQDKTQILVESVVT